MSTITERLATALRQVIDTGVGGKHADQQAALEATRDAIMVLADYDAQAQLDVPIDYLRIHFNGGFHDGADAAECGRCPLWKPEDHPYPEYVSGYFFGVDAYRRLGEKPNNSHEGWGIFAESEWSERIHTFIVRTAEDGDEMELLGASLPEDELAALLSQPGVIYARNQDGVMVELSLDMDFETPVARAVDMTPEGPVYLNPSDELADNAGLKP